MTATYNFLLINWLRFAPCARANKGTDDQSNSLQRTFLIHFSTKHQTPLHFQFVYMISAPFDSKFECFWVTLHQFVVSVSFELQSVRAERTSTSKLISFNLTNTMQQGWFSGNSIQQEWFLDKHNTTGMVFRQTQ